MAERGDSSSSGETGENRKVLEGCSLEQRTATQIVLEFVGGLLKVTIDFSKFAERRTIVCSGERVSQRPDHAIRLAIMNVWVGSVQITQRFLEPIRAGFKNEPLMSSTTVHDTANGQSEFKGILKRGVGGVERSSSTRDRS